MADFQGQTLQVDWEPGLEGLIEGVKGAEKQKEHFLTVRKWLSSLLFRFLPLRKMAAVVTSSVFDNSIKSQSNKNLALKGYADEKKNLQKGPAIQHFNQSSLHLYTDMKEINQEASSTHHDWN